MIRDLTQSDNAIKAIYKSMASAEDERIQKLQTLKEIEENKAKASGAGEGKQISIMNA